MYLFGDSFRVSFKWVVIISTKQEAAHTQSAKVSTCNTLWHFGDWSLITGRGGYKTAGRGGEVKFYPYKSFSGAEGGGGGHKKFPPFKVRLRWLGAVLQYPGNIYSFLFFINILIMIINH